MRRYRFIQLDVFTGTPFGGNQLAVFPEASGLSKREMQAIACEMNFAESTFVLPAADPKALRRVRIFTPTSELPVAGHPVVGTTFALAHEGSVRDGDESPIFLELGVGTLPVEVLFEGQRLSFVWMHQPIPSYASWQGDAAQLVAALNLVPEDLAPDLPIELGSAGVPFLYIPLRSLDVLERARSTAALGPVLQTSDVETNAYLFTLEHLPGNQSAARSRMFAPSLGIVEDAATGIAAGPLGVYLLRHKRIHPDELGEARLRILQGIEMGRPSRLEVAVTGGAAAVRDVRVGGEAVVVAEGELLLPDANDA